MSEREKSSLTRSFCPCSPPSFISTPTDDMECQPVCLGGYPSGTLGQENVPFQREREENRKGGTLIIREKKEGKDG